MSWAITELGITADPRRPWPQHWLGVAQHPWGLVLPPGMATGDEGQAQPWDGQVVAAGGPWRARAGGGMVTSVC